MQDQCHCRAVEILLSSLIVLVSNIPLSADDQNSVDPESDKSAQLLKVFVSEFVDITPGTDPFPKSFSMGSNAGRTAGQPQHPVSIAHDFAIAKYEMPQNLYEAVMGGNPSRWKGPRNSVEMISWQDANRFCRRVTEQLRQGKFIGPTQEIRLPTEAEWEYCCRAGSATPYHFGEKATIETDKQTQASLLDTYAWHTGNAAGNDPAVGELKSNAWGLYDMHGYLWEFVADGWHTNYLAAPSDSRAWDGDRLTGPRVIRGGSWRDRYPLLTSSTRWSVPDHAKSDAIGFRCVKAAVNPGP